MVGITLISYWISKVGPGFIGGELQAFLGSAWKILFLFILLKNGLCFRVVWWLEL